MMNWKAIAVALLVLLWVTEGWSGTTAINPKVVTVDISTTGLKAVGGCGPSGGVSLTAGTAGVAVVYRNNAISTTGATSLGTASDGVDVPWSGDLKTATILDVTTGGASGDLAYVTCGSSLYGGGLPEALYSGTLVQLEQDNPGPSVASNHMIVDRISGSTDNNVIDPGGQSNQIIASCRQDRPCLIGDTTAVNGTDSPVPVTNPANFSWRTVPAYDPVANPNSRVNFSAIAPGSYDVVNQAQTTRIDGDHVFVGPQSGGGGGAGHDWLWGTSQEITGECSYCFLMGTQMFHRTPASTTDTSSNVFIFGSDHFVDGSFAGMNANQVSNISIWGGDGARIDGGFNDSTVLGALDLDVNSSTDGSFVMRWATILGAQNATMDYGVNNSAGYGPTNTIITGDRPHAWLWGQNIWAPNQGYDADLGTDTDPDAESPGMQRWSAVLRREITADDVTTELRAETNGVARLWAGANATWHFDVDASCRRNDTDLESGTMGSFVRWKTASTIQFHDVDDSALQQSAFLINPGTNSQVSAYTVPQDHRFDEDAAGATFDPQNWTLQVFRLQAPPALQLFVRVPDGTDVLCEAFVDVIEIRETR